MTPSNPTNNNPFIFRILDSLGVLHQIAPVGHTHAQSEIEGLTAALNNKAPKSAGTVLYIEGDEHIDLEDVFTDGREMQTWAICTGQESCDLIDLFYAVSSGRLLFPTGDVTTIPSSSWAAIRVVKTIDRGNEPVYLVIIDGIYNDAFN